MVPHSVVLTGLGLFASLMAALISAVGENLTRLSFRIEDLKEDEERRPLHKRPLWMIGILLSTLVNPCLDTTALALAPAAIVQPVAGVKIIANIFFAQILNQQKPGLVTLLWTFMVLASLTVVILFGPHTNASFTFEEIQVAFTSFSGSRFEFIVSLIVISCVSCFVAAIPQMASLGPLYNLCVGVAPGILAGTAAVGLKSALMIIFADLEQEHNAGLRVIVAVVVIAVTITIAITQVTYVNIAASQLPTTFTVPMLTGTFMIVGSLGGILLYEEEPREMLPYMGGMFGIVVGLIGLAFQEHELDMMEAHVAKERLHETMRMLGEGAEIRDGEGDLERGIDATIAEEEAQPAASAAAGHSQTTPLIQPMTSPPHGATAHRSSADGHPHRGERGVHRMSGVERASLGLRAHSFREEEVEDPGSGALGRSSGGGGGGRSTGGA